MNYIQNNNKTKPIEKYIFCKKLCNVLKITETDYYTLDEILNRIIPDSYIGKAKFKIEDNDIATYFGKNINNYIWLNDLKSLVKEKILHRDNTYINKYVVVGHDLNNVKKLVVELY